MNNCSFFYRFKVLKGVISSDIQTASTCSDENTKTASNAPENGTENDAEANPPAKKPRLSNREYKKLMKGQNKVKHS